MIIDEDIKREMIINNVSFKYNSSKNTYTSDGIQREELCNKFLPYYGTNVEFACAINGTKIIAEKIYIPTVLELSNIYGDITKTVPKVTGSIPLQWNADHNNKNGVVILVNGQDNLTGKSTENIAFAEDNGSYTVSGELLKNISQGMSVKVEVLRGNIFVTTDNSGFIYKCFAYSSGVQNFYYGI